MQLNKKLKEGPVHLLQASRGSVIDIHSLALTGILILLTLFGAYLARAFLVPIVLAFVLQWLLAPVVRSLKRLHVAEAFGSGIVLLGLLGILGFGAYRLAGPAGEWVQKGPETVAVVREKLRQYLRPVQKVQKTTKQIEKMTELGQEKRATTVELKKTGLAQVLFTGTQNILLSAGVTLILLYFLLASGDLFLLKLVRVLPTLEEQKRAVEIARQIESDVSTYLSTVTLINCGLGIAVGSAMYFLGMPNPLLWGAMAAILNYIPYLGALTGITVVTFIAILTFDSLAHILSVPTAYFGLNLIEAYIVTPTILGRRLALNPVVIFVWLIFWGWLWGVAGALLAVPMLVILKIVCDHVESLASLGEFLATG